MKLKISLGKIHGGKHYLCKRIIDLFPKEKVDFYVEPFLGFGSVFLNYNNYSRAVLNEKNTSIYKIWQTLKDQGNIWSDVEYCEENFKKSLTVDSGKWNLVQYQFSRGGLGKTFCWAGRVRGGRPECINAWENKKKNFEAVYQKLKSAELYNKCGIDIISSFATENNVLFYIDPPYLPETRKSKDSYGETEMSPENHENLLNALVQCNGTVYISGYDSDMYNDILKGWNKVEFDVANRSSQAKKLNRRKEIVWYA